MVGTVHSGKSPLHCAALSSKHEKDYAAWGRTDGKRLYGDLRQSEEVRRQLVLRAAKELQAYPDRISEYLAGLESGMKQAGAVEATARRLRYEVAAIIASYGIAIEVEVAGPLFGSPGQVSATERRDYRNLETQESWLGLVNTARDMRNAANRRKRLQGGQPQQLGRGNHTVRKFHDAKFNELREQLIERTAANQALDLLDAGIIAVANAYADIASDEIENLREAEQRIYDKVNVRKCAGSVQSAPHQGGARNAWLRSGTG